MSDASFIALRNVGKTYSANGQNKQVFENISLNVPRGSFLSIAGRSGCGKSTLLRLISGLDYPSTGTVRIDGKSVLRPGADRGVVFQDPRLLPWRTVSSNVDLGLSNLGIRKEQRRELVQEHLALVGLADSGKLYPFQLSGGMAQRVALARALVSRPSVLLLDEPFSALDPMTRAQLQETLLRIRQVERLTVVMVTHDVEEAVLLSDRIVVMQPGRLTGQLDISLAHPRDRDAASFVALKQRVSELLRHDMPSVSSFRLVVSS